VTRALHCAKTGDGAAAIGCEQTRCHPDYTALRVRCVALSDGETSPAARKLGAAPLRHPTALFPVSPALLARVNGDPWGRALVSRLVPG